MHIHATLKTKHLLSTAEGLRVVCSCNEHKEAREINLCCSFKQKQKPLHFSINCQSSQKNTLS